MRWPAVILVWLTGAVMLLYGLLVEVEVRRNVGDGVHKGLAEALFSGDIGAWRDHSALWLVAGSVLVLVGLILLRRGDPVRQAKRCQKRQQLAADAAAVARAKAADEADPTACQAWQRVASKSEQRAQHWERQATRATKAATQRAKAISRELERARRH